MFYREQVKDSLGSSFWEGVYNKYDSHLIFIRLFRLIGESIQENENDVKSLLEKTHERKKISRKKQLV